MRKIILILLCVVALFLCGCGQNPLSNEEWELRQLLDIDVTYPPDVLHCRKDEYIGVGILFGFIIFTITLSYPNRPRRIVETYCRYDFGDLTDWA